MDGIVRQRPPANGPEVEGADRFGKYLVMGRIAQGGMAEIYKVKTVGIAGFEKVQVLKRILPAYARDPRFIRSFVDEARIAVSLNHRNIVQVFEFGKVGDDLFLAMELIEGVNLRDAMVEATRTGNRLTVPMVCHLLGEVAAGLDYAHRKTAADGRPLGIVHCDVSPANLALSWEGYVKILDFGVARASFVAAEKGRLRGKPRYMAPEQTRGEPPTAATDVFAVGIVGWELLTGMSLFDGPDVDAILRAIRGAEIPPAASLNPDVPPHLSEAIARALRRDPAQRGTAAELGAAFARAHRELDPGAGSRALSLWLAELFPSPRAAELPEIAPDITRPGMKRAGIEASADLDADDEELRKSTDAAGEPDTLEEKRRVVAAACHLSGGAPEQRRDARRVLADAAYKQGAVVHLDEGDWLIVLFGLQVAGEDDVAQALRFALEAGDAVRDAARTTFAPGLDEPVSLRIGVRQGTASRRRGGDGYLLLGDVLDEARALAHQAAPGRTVLGGSAGRLATARFDFRELAPVKRRARRMRVLELLGARPPERREAALAAGTFHGRDAELAQLVDAYQGTRRDDVRRFAAIVGEAGLGKSRLVAELVRRIPEGRPRLLHLAATPGGRDTPYSMIGDLFAGAVGVATGRGAAARARLLDRLKRICDDRGVAGGDADEFLATVELALEIRDGAAPAAESASANLRDRVVAAISLLREVLMPTARPRLTVIEDWHWLDGASADVMRQIASGRESAGAELVLLTARPDDRGEPPSFPPSVAPIVRLGELPPGDRTALIRARLGEGAAADTVSLVARRAGGNPLFIEELALALRDLAPGELPESARGVIVARVDRLPRGAKAVLQYAAVMGPVFRARILEDLLGRGAGRALRILDGAGLIARATRTDEADGESMFRHGLIQEVVYDALSGAARREAHRRIGLLCAERHDAGKTESPAAVARHLELGGEEARAAQFWLRAGRLALAAYDARAAVHAFTRAIELGSSGDRLREAHSGREQAHFHLGEHDAQKADLDALEVICADDARRLADVMNRAAMRWLRLGDYGQAIAATESAERAAEDGGDERARGEALRIRAEGFERQARFDEALDAVTRALEIFRRIGAATEETRAMIGIGRIHLMSSRFENALAHYAPALERVKNCGDAWLERIIRNNVSVIHLNRGEFAEAMHNAMRSLEICQRFGDRAREGDNSSIVGTILLELGRYEESRQWLARGLDIHAETGSRWSRADSLVYAAHCETLAGDAELGLRWLDEAIALAREIGARYVVANGKNQLAWALVRRGELARADREASEAAEIGREHALPSCEIQGRSRSALARLELGDPAGALAPSMQAVQLLDRVRCIEWSEEEILFTHYRVLRALGDGKAHGYLARAYAGLMSKLTRIDDPEWRSSFADAVELHRRIRDEYAVASARR